MSDEELLEMYEREWKSLMNKVNEVEENIVQIRKRITSNAAQQSVQRTAGTPCKKHDIDFCAECSATTSRR